MLQVAGNQGSNAGIAAAVVQMCCFPGNLESGGPVPLRCDAGSVAG